MILKKLVLIVVMVAIVMNVGFSAEEKADEKAKADRVKWFVEAKFGMFIHWGLYSILGGTWNGRTMPDTSLPNGNSWYAEWIHMRLEVPKDDYQALVKKFNPEKFDADEWIAQAKRAGMRYFVITAKHHDGFALWDSDVSDYDIGATPCKKDLLGDLAKACKKHGVKLGFYYSHWQDWEYKGGALPNWFKKQPTSSEFEVYWQKKSLPQVRELIRKYDPALLWFDTWQDESKKHITPKRRDELIALVRKESPKCLINGRICYHDPGPDIDFLETGDNRHPAKGFNRPWQTPATMCHSWGWHANDKNWKLPVKMVSLLAHNATLGGNYLLNVGPKPDGTFPKEATDRLRAIGEWTEVNGESVFGTVPVGMKPVPGLGYTRRVLEDGTHRLYMFIKSKPKSNQFNLSISSDAVKECGILGSDKSIEFKPSAKGIVVPYRKDEKSLLTVMYIDAKEVPAEFLKAPRGDSGPKLRKKRR